MAVSMKIEEISKRPHNVIPDAFKQMQYGTAGFRDKSNVLRHVVFRMGILSTLRSQHLQKAIGIMITASHNPVVDNGVKIVDPSGEMLSQDWEIIATNIANARNVADIVSHITDKLKIDFKKVSSTYPLIVIGRDTRPSSEELRDAAVEGIAEAMNFPYIDCGVVTTPQLHYVVQKLNEDFAINANTAAHNALSEVYLNRYLDELSSAFLAHTDMSAQVKHAQLPKELIIDCANGVGAIPLQSFSPKLANVLKVKATNDDYKCHEKLNFQSGADFVKVLQKAPIDSEFSIGNRYASFDGDADRVVYYYLDERKTFRLLDGDKIATLLAAYIGDLLVVSGMKNMLSLGLVQTAYANGSSTRYICDILKIPVACVPTGVKHLHKEAHNFDIGVYFEANGHGTVLFSQKACSLLSEKSEEGSTVDDSIKACKKLNYLRQMINPAVGDALSDVLAVEAVLLDRAWSLEDWNNCYTDLPSRQLKVKVSDRSAIQTTDAERQCTKPDNLQPEINALVGKVKNGRSFVRPSGTEDIVRIYAEAETQAAADWLAYDVAMAAYNLAGGVAPEPLKPDFERPAQ